MSSFEDCMAEMSAAVKADEARKTADAVAAYSRAAEAMLRWAAKETSAARKKKLRTLTADCLDRAEALRRDAGREDAVRRSAAASHRADALKRAGDAAAAKQEYLNAAQHLIDYNKSDAAAGDAPAARTLITGRIQSYVECAELLSTLSIGKAPAHDLPPPSSTPPPPPSGQPAAPTDAAPSPTNSPSAGGGGAGGNFKKAANLQHNTMTSEETSFLRGPGSTVYSTRLPIWDDAKEGYPSVHTTLIGRGATAVYEDRSPPALSAQQKEHGGAWMRPRDFLPRSIPPRVIQDPVDPLDITQSVVGNCSYVCSLTVAAAYERRFPKVRLITSSIFPQDAAGRPGVSPTGRYAVKLLVNGQVRMVSIDDRVVVARGVTWVGGPHGGPASASSSAGHSPLCGHSASGDLWVSLLEKAFLKCFGASYDFGGSSSSTDLYHLCGWIPDTLELADPAKEGKAGGAAAAGGAGGVDRAAEWRRLFDAHRAGRVMVTLGTPARGEMPESWREKLGLVAGHAYSVLDFVSHGSVQLLKVMNPWRQHRWKGRYSHQDNKSWTPELVKALGYDRRQEDNGVFWIDWADAVKFFSRANLSWLPHTFSYRVARHVDWKNTMAENNHFFRCPQYTLQVQAPSAGVVWVLLAKHLPGIRRGEDPFVTLHAFDVTGLVPDVRIGQSFNIGKDRWTHNGVYKNTSLHLAKLPVKAGTTTYRLVVSSLTPSPFPHSLTAYSSVQAVHLQALPTTPHPHSKSVAGGWSSSAGSCGGRLGSKDWRKNPQFRFVVKEPCHVTATAEVAKELSLGMSVSSVPAETLKGQGTKWQGRVDTIRNVVLRSGTYGPSFALVSSVVPGGCGEDAAAAAAGEAAQASGPLAVGVYTIVPCTYEAGRESNFRLTLFSTSRQTAESLTVVGDEGAGCVHTKLQGRWGEGAAGAKSVSFRVYGFKELTCRMVVAASSGVLTAKLALAATPAPSGPTTSVAQGLVEYLLPQSTGLYTAPSNPAVLTASVPSSQAGSFVIHCYTDTPLQQAA